MAPSKALLCGGGRCARPKRGNRDEKRDELLSTAVEREDREQAATPAEWLLDPVPWYGVYASWVAKRSELSIGKLASAAGVGVETIRFYERRGLLPEPPRRASGYRQYPPDSVARVLFIRRAKRLGFTLKQITELLELRVDPDKSCADVRALAEAKIDDVDQKMRELKGIKSALIKLANTCRGEGPTSECPILDAIETDDHAER